jgi:hypothetical protein
VVGEETIQPQNSGGTDMTCNIDVNGTSFGHASSFAPQNHDENATPVALVTTTNPSGTAVQLICDANLNPIMTPGAAIYAIPVAAINRARALGTAVEVDGLARDVSDQSFDHRAAISPSRH